LDGKSNVDCATVRRYLSAYHDGELGTDDLAVVSRHLEDCSECSARLAEIRDLSDLAKRLPSPAVPAGIWTQIDERLRDTPTGRQGSFAHVFRRRRIRVALAAAALGLVAVSTLTVVWIAEREHTHVAVNFGRYLDEFERNPDGAEQALLANYAGRAVSYDEAATQLRYRPVTPEQLPNGLSRKAMYLLRMPCCTCVQAIYRRADGQTIAVFEHVDDQPVWFGERPSIQARCNGMPTSLVQVDDCLAASWRQDGRYLTVVGANDVEQVAQLVAFLDSRPPER
jgi:hypothetical protein